MNAARRWMLALVFAVLLGIFVDPLTAGASSGTVRVAGATLNVRSGPSTAYAKVGTLANGSALAVACQVNGQTISGSVRTTAAWDRLTDGRFVTDAYVNWAGAVPAPCSAAGVANVQGSLNQRSNASTLRPAIGLLTAAQAITMTCQLAGESVAGTSGSSALWDRLASGAFVSDAYVGWSSGRPNLAWCSLGTNEAPADHTAFIAWSAAVGRRLLPTYHVPVSVTIAQAILESGWGGSALTRDGNSFFGMKCFGTPGAAATGCRPYPTHECSASSCYATSASFRVYLDALSSFTDHANQLATLARYRAAFAFVSVPDQFAVELQKGGYATSPTYAQNLINLMRQYNLYQYDILL